MNCSILATPIDSSISFSSNSVSSGSTILLSCNDFGHRIVGGDANATCTDGKWSGNTSSVECKWNWNLTTHEKLVLGTSISAGLFILLMIMVIFIAYYCCYKRRIEDEKNYEEGYEDSNGHVKNNNFDTYGPPLSEGRHDAYYAYQESDINKSYGHDNPAADVSGIDKPWMGYIPRPKIADRTYYNM